MKQHDLLIVQEVAKLPKQGKETTRVQRALGLYRELMATPGDTPEARERHDILPTLINFELARMEPAEQAAYYKGTQSIREAETR